MASKTGKYEDYDWLLMEAIESGKNTYAALTSAMHEASKPFASSPEEDWRVVDRRLQALRRKGWVSCIRKGRHIFWSVHV